MSKDSVVRNNIWKWLILALVGVISFYVCNPPSEKLRFGLDLKGGTSFTLGVDKEKLAESIIAANPSVTNTEGGVEAEIDAMLNRSGCDDMWCGGNQGYGCGGLCPQWCFAFGGPFRGCMMNACRHLSLLFLPLLC